MEKIHKLEVGSKRVYCLSLCHKMSVKQVPSCEIEFLTMQRRNSNTEVSWDNQNKKHLRRCFCQTHSSCQPFSIKTCQDLHPWSLTWNLRIHPWKRKIIFQTIIFRFYIKLQGCTLPKNPSVSTRLVITTKQPIAGFERRTDEVLPMAGYVATLLGKPPS